MFGTGAIVVILEKWQFLAYATNLEIPPSAFLKVWVLFTYINFLCPLRCIRVYMPGPGSDSNGPMQTQTRSV